MARYIALLRAVNVGGHGKIEMRALKELCESAGFEDVRTYIASGNVVFTSALTRTDILAALQAGLKAHTGAEVGVFLRSGTEMAGVLESNPFADKAPNKTVAIFLDGPPPADAASHVRGRKDEEIALGASEIYVHYPAGQAGSRLVIPAAKTGTARNMNTLLKLCQMAGAA